MELSSIHFTECTFFGELMAERNEVMKHKWIESEKVGFDIGFNKALMDWVIKHRSAWREYRKKRCLNEK